MGPSFFSAFKAAIRGHGFEVLILGYSVTLWTFLLREGDLAVPSSAFFSAMAIPAVGLLGMKLRRARPWLALVVIALSFQVIAEPIDNLADANGAYSFADFDRYLWGFDVPGWVQNTFSSTGLTEAMTAVYLGLVPFVLATAGLLWAKWRGTFERFVSSLVLTSFFALVTFVLIPTAPPWLSGGAANLVSTPGLESVPASFVGTTSFVPTDYFAAFPSLHAAYTLTAAYFLYSVKTRLGVLGLLAAAATLFSTLYLGQHNAVDLVGGAAYSLVSCWLAGRLLPAGRGERVSPAVATSP